MKIQYAVVSVAGMVRAVNEDNFYLNGEVKNVTRANCSMRSRMAVKQGLFAVCDGLGGEGNGEQAASLAVNLMKKYQDNFGTNYMEYIDEVNQKICKEQNVYSARMGCTLAALDLNEKCITSVNMGDTRIYRFSGNSLEILTEDHSEFATMLKYGVFTEADYYSSPARNRLTRLLGMDEQEGKLQPYVVKDILWEDKDIFLICSDGLCSAVVPNEIKGILQEKGSLLFQCRKLMKRAVEHGSDDNITVMLIKVFK